MPQPGCPGRSGRHAVSPEDGGAGSPRKYRSIFLAGPIFNLRPDDDAALLALTGIRKHLDDGGTALIPLFIPSPTPADPLGRAKETADSDGSTLRVTVTSQERDERAKVQRTVLRYERVTDGGSVVVVERPWILHWYSPQGFGEIAAAAGLITSEILDDGNIARDNATEFTFVLQRSD